MHDNFEPVQYTLIEDFSWQKQRKRNVIAIEIFLRSKRQQSQAQAQPIIGSSPRLINNNNNGGGRENGGLAQCEAVYDCIREPQQNKLQFHIYYLVEDVDYGIPPQNGYFPTVRYNP